MKRFQNTFTVGVYTCEMTYTQQRGLRTEWSPHLPKAKSFTKQDMEQYRAGRDKLMQEIGKELGGSVLVVET